MKRILIIYNLIFLFAGNILFSNIHYTHDHNHYHEHETNKCQKCISIDNSNNYILDFQEVKFSNNYINQFIFQYLSTIKLHIVKRYSSRAPPIS